MKKTTKVSKTHTKARDTQRIARWVGAQEAESYSRLYERFAAVQAKHQERFLGGIELVAPAEVQELSGNYRPGLIYFAHEAAGDSLVWDRRRGDASPLPPVVLYCDHELGTAQPFAGDILGAFNHLLLLALVGTPGAEGSLLITRWLDDYASFLDPRVREQLVELAERGRAKPKTPIFRKQAQAQQAAQHLIPKHARGGLAMLPPTHVPLLSPEDPDCLESAATRYEESIETYRELIEEEKRNQFTWWLAAALRGLADVRLRLKDYKKAAAAATEAIALYEPLSEAGDARVASGLAFVHRVLATTEARAKRFESAFHHADRAMFLNDALLYDSCVVLDALDRVATAWEDERAGKAPSDVRLALNSARSKTAAYRDADPPHPYQPQSERIERLAVSR